MPRQERRASIVEATMPLLEEHGLQLTTKQVADAAGVAEGTIFRAFESLQDVVDATITAALSPDRLKRMLAENRFPGDLHGDTAAAMEAVGRHYDAIRTMVHISHLAAPADSTCARDRLTDRHDDLLSFLAERFESHSDELTITPRQFAQLILVLASGQRTHAGLGIPSLSDDDLVTLALDGARKDAR